MNNKIEILVNVDKNLSLNLKFDDVLAALEINPSLLLNPLKIGDVDLFLPLSGNVLSKVVVALSEEEVFWYFPENKDYLNLSNRSLVFNKMDYLNAIQGAIYEFVGKTNFNKGVDREKILLSTGTLKKFIKENKEKLLETLSITSD